MSEEQYPGIFAHTFLSGSGDLKFKYLNHYYYYDTPADKDLAKKIGIVSAYTSVIGGFVGLHETLMLHKPKNAAGFVGRMIFWVGPSAGIGAAFCTGTYVATKLRGKDDGLSHFLGGMAAGSIVGAWRSSIFGGMVTGVGLGLIAIVSKMSNKYQIPLFPETYRLTGGVNTSRKDYSLQRDDLPRGWTTNPNEA